jgi:signal transduction histidine kinase
LAAESEARRLEAEMAMTSNERAVAAREYLIRGFTHDVKNPLNVAVGYAELLELGHKGTLPIQQVDMLGRIRSAIHDAVEIINELLEISRLESPGLQVKRKATDLGALTSEVVREHAMAASVAGLDLRFVSTEEPRESLTTFTDPERVRQVLTNLITNALKYTPSPGEVTVRSGVAPKDLDHPGRRVRMMVTDSGPGIPLEEQERIFYEFHRVPGSTAGGHGLGLAISKRISRILGGDLTVESVPGQGATFTLWLPLRRRGEVEADAWTASTP